MYDYNSVLLRGKVDEVENEHKMRLRLARTSGTEDVVPVRSEEIIRVNSGDEVVVWGKMWSANETENDKRRLKVYIAAERIMPSNKECSTSADVNNIRLIGTICKEVNYRVTPLGREIAECMLATNCNGESAYIPVIIWGRKAQWAFDNLHVGDKVKVFGRFQSREYSKVIDETKSVICVAYELSAYKVFKITKAVRKDEDLPTI